MRVDPDLYHAVLHGRAELEDHLVLADALSSTGDPRGELVALQAHRASTHDIVDLERVTQREREVLAQTELWGDYDPEWMSAEWRLGWIRELAFRVQGDRAEDIKQSIAHPSYEGVNTILFEVLGNSLDDIDLTEILAGLASSDAPIRTVIVNGSGPTRAILNLEVLAQLPQLECVELRNCQVRGTWTSETVRHLRLGPQVVSPEQLSGVLQASAHALESVELSLTEDSPGYDPKRTCELLDAARNLTHLDLRGIPDADAWTRELVAAPFLLRLKRLDLTRGGLETSHLTTLGETLEAGSLEFLNIDGNDLGGRLLALQNLDAEIYYGEQSGAEDSPLGWTTNPARSIGFLTLPTINTWHATFKIYLHCVTESGLSNAVQTYDEMGMWSPWRRESNGTSLLVQLARFLGYYGYHATLRRLYDSALVTARFGLDKEIRAADWMADPSSHDALPYMPRWDALLRALRMQDESPSDAADILREAYQSLPRDPDLPVPKVTLELFGGESAPPEVKRALETEPPLQTGDEAELPEYVDALRSVCDGPRASRFAEILRALAAKSEVATWYLAQVSQLTDTFLYNADAHADGMQLTLDTLHAYTDFASRHGFGYRHDEIVATALHIVLLLEESSAEREALETRVFEHLIRPDTRHPRLARNAAFVVAARGEAAEVRHWVELAIRGGRARSDFRGETFTPFMTDPAFKALVDG